MEDKTMECPCCGTVVKVGAVWCPHCRIGLLSPDEFEEVIKNGNYRSS